MPDSALFGSHLEDSFFSVVNLSASDLHDSDLRGAKLINCKLDAARLYGVKIDNGTVFERTNWWAANFYEDASNSFLDTALLEALYNRVRRLNKDDVSSFFGEGTDLSNWLEKAHPSVRKYVEGRQGKQ